MGTASYNPVSLAAPKRKTCDSGRVKSAGDDRSQLAEDRRQLRKRLRSARRSVIGSERAGAEAAICTRLLSLEVVRRASRVALFLADDGEPDLANALQQLDRLGVALALPGLASVETAPAGSPGDVMDFRPWAPTQPLHTGRFGIVEPATASRLAVTDLAVVLTPLVGFDPAGNRIGRGAGYYDRAFGLVRDDANRPVLIGVAFETQRIPSLPCESHDVPLDVVVTELGIRWC